MNIQHTPSVNFHLTEACNMSCKFCFATFDDVQKEKKRLAERIQIIQALAEAGFEKITFAGGEPTIDRDLPILLHTAKAAGLTTMVVTNGSRILEETYFNLICDQVDWFILSIDSITEATNLASGRSTKHTVITKEQYLALIQRIHARGKRLKINTVVSCYNKDESLADFILASKAERWKIFQALPVKGQNDGKMFEVSEEEFNQYLDRNSTEALKNIVVPEDNDSMTGSYLMIAPNGRFFDNSKGFHTYSRRIVDVGIVEALKDVHFDAAKYLDRGGLYN